jgi:hypothetical protein
MKPRIPIAHFSLVALSVGAFAQTPAPRLPPGNYDEAKVGAYTLPELLRSKGGSPVANAETWRKSRRPEILEAYFSQVYGRTPKLDVHLRAEVVETETKAVGGLATRTRVTLRFFDEPDAPVIHLLLYVPNAARGPAPVFLGLNYFGPASIENDPALPLTDQWMRPAAEMGIVGNRATEKTRGIHASRWPLALALSRGYAVATYYYGDLEPDHADGWRTGLRGFLRKKTGRTGAEPDEWGAIGVWAWGLSRALDYLETNPAVDARRVTVFGHSRHGKTALWAGAQDERFAAVISNNSGEGGASLSRREFGETVADSVRMSGWWYCENYRRYAGHAADLPTDQHMLLALCAPRPLYIASATEDLWADPRGEFLSAVHAAPAYRLLGLEGLGTEEMPRPDHPIGRRIGYHLRTGKHDITAYDWTQFLDFTDRLVRK